MNPLYSSPGDNFKLLPFSGQTDSLVFPSASSYRDANVTQILELFIEEEESESRSVVSSSLQPHRLCSPWNSLARILGWVTFPFSKDSSQSRELIQVSSIPGKILYQMSHKGSPLLALLVEFSVTWCCLMSCLLISQCVLKETCKNPGSTFSSK